MRIPIQIKTLIVLAAFAVVPLVAAILLLLPDYGRAVKDSEERYQLIVVSEAASEAERVLAGAHADASSVAEAFSAAAKLEGSAAAGESIISAALSSRQHIDVARVEVPTVKLDQVFAKPGADKSLAPTSTTELRKIVDEEGIAFDIVDDVRGLIVVAIPSVEVRGYVTVPVYLRPIRDALAEVVATRDLDPQASRVVVVDGRRRVIAAFGFDRAAAASARDLPLWDQLTDNPRGTSLGLKVETSIDGVPMVAAIHTLGELGWAVASWQPREHAFAEYARVKELLLAIAVGLLAMSLLAGVFAARAVTKPVLSLVEETGVIGRRAWDELSPPLARGDEIGDLSRAVRQMAEDLQIGEAEIAREATLRRDLSRFMSQEVVERVVAGDHSMALGGRRANVTVMFADMVAFTRAAEQMPPEQVVGMLNELFTVLTEAVFRHEGIVDKFIGDCVMGVWGAPVEDPDHAVKALEAAEDMMAFLEAGSEKWRDEYGVEVRLAIGINSGSAIVGNIGSDKRMDYTVVGDVVNVAARLETIAAPNQVLVGAATQSLASDFDLRLLGDRNLTGRDESVQVYELQTH